MGLRACGLAGLRACGLAVILIHSSGNAQAQSSLIKPITHFVEGAFKAEIRSRNDFPEALGTGSCKVEITGYEGTDIRLIVRLSKKPTNCMFADLKFILGEKSYALDGLDDNFIQRSNGAYSWQENKGEDAWMSFYIGSRLPSNALQNSTGSFGVYEYLCNDQSCLTSPNIIQSDVEPLVAAAKAAAKEKEAILQAEKAKLQREIDASIQRCDGDRQCRFNAFHQLGIVACGKPKLSFDYMEALPTYKGGCENGQASGWGFAYADRGYIFGNFKNGKLEGYGSYAVSECIDQGFFGCRSSRLREYTGWFKDSDRQLECRSTKHCEDIQKTIDLVNSAQKSGRCEIIQTSITKADTRDQSSYKHYLESCMTERVFNGFVSGKSARAMYLGAVDYEDKGERSRAKTIYREITKRFPNAQEALLASQRLTRLSDVEAVESSNSNASSRAESAALGLRTQNYEQCKGEEISCYSRCDQIKNSSAQSSCKSSCFKGCQR